MFWSVVGLSALFAFGMAAMLVANHEEIWTELGRALE